MFGVNAQINGRQTGWVRETFQTPHGLLRHVYHNLQQYTSILWILEGLFYPFLPIPNHLLKKKTTKFGRNTMTFHVSQARGSYPGGAQNYTKYSLLYIFFNSNTTNRTNIFLELFEWCQKIKKDARAVLIPRTFCSPPLKLLNNNNNNCFFDVFSTIRHGRWHAAKPAVAIPTYKLPPPIDGVGNDQMTPSMGVRVYTLDLPLGPFAESCEELGADSEMDA